MTATASRTGTAANRLGTAVALAERGFAVFPLRPDSKVPAVREDWEGLAVSDPRRLRELGWPPGGNIGIACGPSGLFVLDLDVPKEASPQQAPPRDGAHALRELADGRPIPRTFTVTTPSGGTHLYFRAPKGVRLRNTVARLGALIDTRAAGGYVVAPGSVIGGRPYEIADDSPVAPVPRWIVRELAARSRAAVPALPAFLISRSDVAGSRMPGAVAAAYGAAALRNEVERMRTARIGTRNDTLNRAAYALGRLVGSGLLDRDLAASELFHAARQAGLPARECATTLASGLGAGIARPRFPARRRSDTRSTAVRILTAERADAAFEDAVTETAPDEAVSDEAVSAETVSAETVSAETASAADSGVIDALRVMDQAYDAVALSAASLVFSQDWRRVRALMDALRDLRDTPHFGPAQRRHASRLCEAVHELATTLERAVRGPARRTSGLRRGRSPLSKALRDLKLAADAAIEALNAPAADADQGRGAA